MPPRGGGGGRRRGPEAEGAIHVHPRARLVRAAADLRRGIKRAGVHVAGLHADDRARVQPGQAVGAHAALIVDGHALHALATEAEHAERFEQ